MKFYLTIIFLILSANILSAQSKSPKKTVAVIDTTKITLVTESPVKSLSQAEYDQYQKGDPMGLTKPAELNNYPAPSRILALQTQLKITPDQKSKLIAAQDALDFKAKEMGKFIIQNEKRLNDLFVTGKINEGSLIYYTNQFGLYQGELRNAHLQAHLKTRRILTPDQLKKFGRLREMQTKAE